MTMTEDIKDLIPTTAEDLKRELFYQLNLGREHEQNIQLLKAIFHGDELQIDEVMGKDAFFTFLHRLQDFVTQGIRFYRMEPLRNITLNTICGMALPTTPKADLQMGIEMPYRKFALEYMEAKSAEWDASEPAFIPPEDTISHFSKCTNYYIFVVLALHALDEEILERYRRYVLSRISMFSYTLAFWDHMEDLSEIDSITELLWADLFSRSIGVQPSSQRMAALMKNMKFD
jgi:hypothetical protein